MVDHSPQGMIAGVQEYLRHIYRGDSRFRGIHRAHEEDGTECLKIIFFGHAEMHDVEVRNGIRVHRYVTRGDAI